MRSTIFYRNVFEIIVSAYGKECSVIPGWLLKSLRDIPFVISCVIPDERPLICRLRETRPLVSGGVRELWPESVRTLAERIDHYC